MKKRVFLLVVLSLVMISLFSAEKVVFATGEWEPYSSSKMPEYGLYGEMISAICHAEGIKRVYEFYPWVRAEKMVDDGEAFAAFPYALTEERKKQYLCGDVILKGQNRLYCLKSNTKVMKKLKYKNLSELQEFRFGILNGSFLEDDFNKAGIKYTKVFSIDAMIQQLKAGQVDLIVEEEVVVSYTIKKLYSKQSDLFQVFGRPYGKPIPTSIIVSRTYPNSVELLKKFNHGLQKIKDNGEYDRIINKYLIK